MFVIGCGDPLSQEDRELVPCDRTGATGGQCERACLGETGPSDTGETCMFTNGFGVYIDCANLGSTIVKAAGIRGCCSIAPGNTYRWSECE